MARFRLYGEIFSQDFHDSAVDLWSVGHLLMKCGATKRSAPMLKLQESLLSNNPKERPSIDECLAIVQQEASKKSVELPISSN